MKKPDITLEETNKKIIVKEIKKMTFDATFKYLKIIVDMKTKTKREFHKREM